MVKCDMSTSEVIGRGYNTETLSNHIRRSLEGSQGMTLGHFRPDVGQDRSVRIFGQRPFEKSVAVPVVLDPEGVARELMFFTRVGARYPQITILTR